jgi:PAS domain S-box-containing protein
MSKLRAKSNAFTKALSQAIAPAGEAVTVADCEGYIIEANDAVERVYRWSREQIVGKHPLKFCPETPEWKKLSDKIWQTIAKDGSWDGVVINKDAEEYEFPILLRTRKVVYKGIDYVISWARPFPSGAPFGLSEREAEVFQLLAQYGGGAKEIAARLLNKDKRNSPRKGIVGVSESTVIAHLRRIWEKAGNPAKTYSISEVARLAIRCLEAGWVTTMKRNQEIYTK